VLYVWKNIILKQPNLFTINFKDTDLKIHNFAIL
jgi:hypothetical protein